MCQLGLGLLPLLDQFRPLSNVGPIPSPPHYLPVIGISAPGVLVVLGIRGWVLWCVLAHSRWLLAGAWTPGLGRAYDWGVICPGVSDLWVHCWICSGVDGCRRGLWARRCSSLGLLHCGCWVVSLAFSPAPSWGGSGSPGSGSPGVPVLWGAFGCLWLGFPPYLSQVLGGRSVAPHTYYCIF
ncbi:hypothetical protein CHARACLAT_018980 [Characodon lateralis]|uniref:Uncharacterized protein n=1 Tax=Characodon lateralis TaxID=208331 RepID=A0ABU7E2G1_9TELE|nr:hypothetical protein [Characodon lateralis]